MFLAIALPMTDPFLKNVVWMLEVKPCALQCRGTSCPSFTGTAGLTSFTEAGKTITDVAAFEERGILFPPVARLAGCHNNNAHNKPHPLQVSLHSISINMLSVILYLPWLAAEHSEMRCTVETHITGYSLRFSGHFKHLKWWCGSPTIYFVDFYDQQADGCVAKWVWVGFRSRKIVHLMSPTLSEY